MRSLTAGFIVTVTLITALVSGCIPPHPPQPVPEVPSQQLSRYR